jgi:hypothetical protein
MSYKMKSFLTALVLYVGCYNALGQDKLAIRLDEKSETVTVGELTLDGGLTNARIIEVMGKPSRQADYPSGEVSLFYEEKGIVFFTRKNIVTGLGINFNSDGDNKFPATSLNGKLMIGATEITKESTQSDIKNIKEVVFVCPHSLMCASSKRDAKTNVVIGFKDGVLTQVAFLLNTK